VLDNLSWIVWVIVVYSIVLFVGFLWGQNRRKEYRDLFFKTVRISFLDGTLNHQEELKNIYKGIYGDVDESRLISGLNKNLRMFLVALSSDKFRYKVEPKEDLIKLVNFINQTIKDNETNKPFSEVPILERSYLIDAKAFVEAGKNPEAIDKLVDLGGLIQSKQDMVEKLQKSNKWSVPLAVIGLILTVIFGTMQSWPT